MQANEKKGFFTKIREIIFAEKVKKYLPIILTSTIALALAAITGGIGLLIAGVFVASIVFVQNLDAIIGELSKGNEAKLNRPLYIRQELSSLKKPPKSVDQFKLPLNENIKPKSYLLLGEKDNIALYYVDSECVARKMIVQNLSTFVEKVKKNKNLKNSFIPEDKGLNEAIKQHVIPNKLQKTRRSAKQILALIGFGIAIAGVLAAMPFVGIPLAGAIAITSIGLGIALLAPMVGRVLKKSMDIPTISSKNETKFPQVRNSSMDTELEIEHQLEDHPRSKEVCNEANRTIERFLHQSGSSDKKLNIHSPALKESQTHKNEKQLKENEDESEGEGFHP